MDAVARGGEDGVGILLSPARAGVCRGVAAAHGAQRVAVAENTVHFTPVVPASQVRSRSCSAIIKNPPRRFARRCALSYYVQYRSLFSPVFFHASRAAQQPGQKCRGATARRWEACPQKGRKPRTARPRAVSRRASHARPCARWHRRTPSPPGAPRHRGTRPAPRNRAAPIGAQKCTARSNSSMAPHSAAHTSGHGKCRSFFMQPLYLRTRKISRDFHG